MEDPRDRYRQMMMSQSMMPDVSSMYSGGMQRRAAELEKPEGHGLLDWLPAITGTIGGIGGGLLGTAIAPGAGSLAGGVAGAGGGQAFGKWLENAITGDKQDAGEIAREGLYGAGGQLAGGIIGKGVAKIGGKLLGRVAAPEVAETVTKEAPSRFTAAGRMNELANNLYASQYGTISKPVARQVNLPETVEKLASYGVTKPQDAERIADAITGADGILTKAVRSAVGDAGRVPIDNLKQISLDAAGEQVWKNPSEKKATLDFIQSALHTLAGGEKGSLIPGADPSKSLEVIRMTEKQIAQLTGKGGTYHLPTASDLAQTKVLGAFRDQLEENLYEVANANGAIAKVVTPQLRNELINLHPKNAAWEKHIDDVLLNAQTPGDLRHAMAPFVRISKAIREGEINSPTYGGRGGDAFSWAALLERMVRSNPVRRVAANSLKKGSEVADGATPGSLAMSPAAQTFASQLGATTLANATDDESKRSAIPAGADFSSPEAALMGGGAAGMEPGAAMGMSGASDPTPGLSGYTNDELAQALRNDIEKNGGANLDDIVKLIQLNESGQKATGMDAATKKALGSVDRAEGAIQQLQGMYEGGQGRFAGNVAKFGGSMGLNPQVKAYEDARRGVASQIARSLAGETGTMTDQDIDRILGLIPQTTDTPEEAQSKWGMLTQMVANAKASANRYGFPESPDEMDFSQYQLMGAQ